MAFCMMERLGDCKIKSENCCYRHWGAIESSKEGSDENRRVN